MEREMRKMTQAGQKQLKAEKASGKAGKVVVQSQAEESWAVPVDFVG